MRMRNLLIFCLLFIWIGTNTLTGQILEPVFVIESSRTIKTKTASKKRIKSRAGTTLEYGAKLCLKKNQSVTLLMNGNFVTFKGKGKHILEKNEKEASKSTALNFDPLFGEFLKASFGIANQNIINGNIGFVSKHAGDGWASGISDPKSKGGWGVTDPKSKGGWGVTDPKSKGGWGVTDPKSKGGWGVTEPKSKGGWGVTDPKSKGGWGVTDPKSKGGWGVTDPKSKGGWGVTDPKSKGGWGIEDMTIAPLIPGGLYKHATNNVKWVKEADVDQYLVCVFDEDMNMVFSEISKTDNLDIDMSNFDTDKTYFWQVFANLKKAISVPVTFTLATKDDMEMVQLNCETSNLYCNNSNEALKGLMDAVALESANMYLESCQKYKSLVSSFPKNNLIKMSFAAYYLRMGQHRLAQEQYAGIK